MRNAVIHSDGCGQIAFYYDGTVSTGDILSADRATLVDGSNPRAGEVVSCGSCGGSLRSIRVGDIEAHITLRSALQSFHERNGV